jgi:hypothetical protein
MRPRLRPEYEREVAEWADVLEKGCFVLVLLAGFLGVCVGLAAGVMIMWTVW